MRIDPRADAIFKKKYYLNDEQVKVMHETFNYQWTVLRFYVRDFFSILKACFLEVIQIIKKSMRGGDIK